jgi:murein DD-endopeptidase MepM/ murein hydrolase activator NlpD
VVIVYGHVADITVKAGDVVRAGDVVARVGNDGVSRSPHLHVGAYRVTDSMPLQIRWDQRTFGP